MSLENPTVETISTTNDYLIVGGEVNTQSLPIAAGQEIVRGEMLFNDAGSLKKMVAGKEADAKAIATYGIDTTSGASNAEVYVEGRFDESNVEINDGDLAAIKMALASDIQLVKRY